MSQQKCFELLLHRIIVVAKPFEQSIGVVPDIQVWFWFVLAKPYRVVGYGADILVGGGESLVPAL